MPQALRMFEHCKHIRINIDVDFILVNVNNVHPPIANNNCFMLLLKCEMLTNETIIIGKLFFIAPSAPGMPNDYDKQPLQYVTIKLSHPQMCLYTNTWYM